jgi:hypothetical protein
MTGSNSNKPFDVCRQAYAGSTDRNHCGKVQNVTPLFPEVNTYDREARIQNLRAIVDLCLDLSAAIDRHIAALVNDGLTEGNKAEVCSFSSRKASITQALAETKAELEAMGVSYAA